jgi:hypothetical protein
MFLALTFALGAFTMTTADAQEKKDEKKLPDLNKKESYDEKVTVREKAGDKLGPPVKDVPMYRTEVKGEIVMWVITSKAPKGSEITDKDGITFIVNSSTKTTGNFTISLCKVSKKPEEKP